MDEFDARKSKNLNLNDENIQEKRDFKEKSKEKSNKLNKIRSLIMNFIGFFY